MTTTPDRKDLGSRLERLERSVRNLQRRSTLSSASISGGNLTVRDGGNIRIIEGGNLIGEGGGRLDWEGNAHLGGTTTIDGDTTIGGDLAITGNTSITGTLELQEGIIGPGALSLRTEAKTFGGTGSTSNTNTYTVSVPVAVPDWTVTTSVVAMGSVQAADDEDTSFTAWLTIAGDDGPTSAGAISVGLPGTIPALHRRDFSPAADSSFNVVLHGGKQGVAAMGFWGMSVVVMAVFNN